ncbi:hypothetical protein ACLBXM_02615 [Xanthobacteraceae bacterium A53D]
MSEADLEFSPLSSTITRDGISVDVSIYRVAGAGNEWTLEVTDDEGGSTVWEATFQTDQDAFREFYATLEREGILCFREGPFAGRLH